MKIEATVPLRAEVTDIRPDGIPRDTSSPRGIQMAKLVEIMCDTVGSRPQGRVTVHALGFDYEGGSADIAIQCDDDTWMGAVQTFLAGKDVAALDDYMKRTRVADGRFVHDPQASRDETAGSRFAITAEQLALVKERRGGSARMDTGNRRLVER